MNTIENRVKTPETIYKQMLSHVMLEAFHPRNPIKIALSISTNNVTRSSSNGSIGGLLHGPYKNGYNITLPHFLHN